MIAARKNGVAIRTFEVSGFYSQLTVDGNGLSGMMAEALHNVEDLRLIDSPSLLEFMATIFLGSVRRLELETCWLCVRDLEQFVITNAKTLQFLHLEDTWVAAANLHYWGLSLCDSSSETIVANIACIRELGILRGVTINRGKADGYEY